MVHMLSTRKDLAWRLLTWGLSIHDVAETKLLFLDQRQNSLILQTSSDDTSKIDNGWYDYILSGLTNRSKLEGLVRKRARICKDTVIRGVRSALDGEYNVLEQQNEETKKTNRVNNLLALPPLVLSSRRAGGDCSRWRTLPVSVSHIQHFRHCRSSSKANNNSVQAIFSQATWIRCGLRLRAAMHL